MKPKTSPSTVKYSSMELKKRIKEYSKKVKKNKPALSSTEPTGVINNISEVCNIHEYSN